MANYPVIMCGGSGTRLWPASRPSRPKQFIPLLGPLSSFQQTILRLTGVENASQPVIVAGRVHAAAIREQLAALGVEATLLLEPEARDSAPAMAAAAAWVAAQDPEGVMVVCASDHHVPDAGAFRAAVNVAARAAADDGLIVTLGVRPSAPSSAYGYIQPAEGAHAVKPVAAFVEKPGEALAKTYVEAGYLWNSGNFVVSAKTLLAELDAFAPAVSDAARVAVIQAAPKGGGLLLGPGFSGATKISIDYAVMEKTVRAAVLPVDFEWSDLGAWDAIQAAAASAEGDACGNAVGPGVIVQGATNCLVRNNGSSQVVALIGVSDLAVVIENDAILVCGLQAAQDVKGVVDQLKALGHGAVDIASAGDLRALADRLTNWLMTQALPVWWALGADHGDGGFVEAIGQDGGPLSIPRRGRLNGRQAYSFATAGRLGWAGPWRQAALHGLEAARTRYRRSDGQFRTLVGADGAVLDDAAFLYDQAFFLLGTASLQGATGGEIVLEAEALALLDMIETRRGPAGGFIETGDDPNLSNPLMHLFEAALAWDETGASPRWAGIADEIAELALNRMIDSGSGAIREYFDPAWAPAPGDAGRRIEPGHQFEWAWLLTRWGLARQNEAALVAARRMYAAGRRGVDLSRGVAIDAQFDDFSVLSQQARLWPQTEWLKASLILADTAGEAEREDYLSDARSAAIALSRYLETPTPGLWRDKLTPQGQFIDEAAPASSLYHLVAAIQELQRART